MLDSDTLIIGARSDQAEVHHERGTTVGRYLILDELGRGGMGVVYRAYDPDLDRAIALKLLRVAPSKDDPDRSSDRAEDRRARLLREAQALAQLTHPNVVSVYDVGIHEDEVFMALELLDGQTAATWLAADRRRPVEVLRVFIAAGEGLAAAHRVGLVHRDFKPSNVIVGTDGRVSVIDFGVARASEGFGRRKSRVRTVEDKSSGSNDGSSDGDGLEGLGAASQSLAKRSLSSSLTIDGAVVGTPVYMSPEQHRRLDLSPASDQFSFCVSLYEALFGQRPFEGSSYRELRASVIRGELRVAPKTRGVPAHVVRAIEKGLSNRPGQRFESMEDLLSELRRDPAKMRRRVAGATGVLALGAVAAAGWIRDDESPAVCTGAQERVAQVWNPRVRQSLRGAFESSGSTLAESASQRVIAGLDDFSRQWSETYTSACKATMIYGEQSAEALDLRMGCLQGKLRQVEQLVGILSSDPDDALVQRAVQATSTTADLTECNDVEGLRDEIPLPDDPTAREAIEEARRLLEQAAVVHSTGDYEKSHAYAGEAAALARELEYPPLTARARLMQGRSAEKSGQWKEAEELLRELLFDAAQARDDVILASAWIELAWVLGYRLERNNEALALETTIEVAVERAGGLPQLRANAARVFGALHSTEGDYEAAEKYMRRYVDLHEEEGSGVDGVVGFANLGLLLLYRDEVAEGRRYLERALELGEETIGPDHPQVTAVLTNLALALKYQGELERSYEIYREVADRRMRVGGERNPNTILALSNLASASFEIGKHEEALELGQRVVALRQEVEGPRVLQVGWDLGTLAQICWQMGLRDQAREHLAEAADIIESSLAADHPDTLRLRRIRATFDCETDEHAAGGFEELAQIRRIAQERQGVGHTSSAVLLTTLASCAERLGRLEEARQSWKTVLDELVAEQNKDESLVAAARFGLARTSWALGERNDEVLRLARQAAEGYERSSLEAHQKMRREVEVWISARE